MDKKRVRKIQIWIACVLVFAALFVGIPGVRAAGYEAICTEELGGTWNADKNSCTLDVDSPVADTFCRDFEYAVLVFGAADGFLKCFPFRDEQTTGVSAGEPVDAWYGNCGIYILSPPVSGYVVISKTGYHTSHRAPDFVKPTCTAVYYDEAGNVVENYRSLAWIYFNLDANSRKLWDAGELRLYYLRPYYNRYRWWYCSKIYLVDAGDHGRLACIVDTPRQFGIGVESKRR